MFDLKPLFFVLCRLTALFCCIGDGQENRHPKWKCLCVRELPTLFRQGHPHFSSARIPPPRVSNQPFVLLNTFGWLQRGWNLPPKGGILFRELRPPFPEQGHTQSGLRADTPKDGRAFQGSPKTHPDCFWTFGAWIGSTTPLCGFCWCCSPSPSTQPEHRLYTATASQTPPSPLSSL